MTQNEADWTWTKDIEVVVTDVVIGDLACHTEGDMHIISSDKPVIPSYIVGSGSAYS